MKTRLLSIALALCMALSLTSVAYATEGNSAKVVGQTDPNGNIQYVDSVSIPDGTATNCIFLNGNDAVISADVTDESYVLKIEVKDTTYTYELTTSVDGSRNIPSIFGGKYVGNGESSETVTAEGNQTVTVDASVQLYQNRYYPISRLLAGGAGDATAYGSRQAGIEYASSTTNGMVKLDVNGYVSAIRGGGSGDSSVSEAIINLSGQAYTIYGGGDAPYGSVADLTDGTKSTCHVEKATINIAETGHATFVYGGGYSIASVGTASITVAGDAGTVTASGTNGYTGSSTVKVEPTATITPSIMDEETGELYPAILYGWNGYGVAANVTNEGTINGNVVLGTLSDTYAVSGSDNVLSFTNNGTVTGTAVFGNVGTNNIKLSGDIILNAQNFDGTGTFALAKDQTITLSDGATWTGEIVTTGGTILSASSSPDVSGEIILSAQSNQGSSPVASVNGYSYDSLAEAITNASTGDTVYLLNGVELSSAIDRNITIQGNGKQLEVKDNGAVNANVILNNTKLAIASEGVSGLLQSTGVLTVGPGSSLTMLDTEMIGDNGNLKLANDGSIALQMSSGKLDITINGKAEIPENKQLTTRMTTGASESSAILVDVTVAEDSTLTVSSSGSSAAAEDHKYGLRVANDTTLTVNGTLDASKGVFDQSNRGNVVIGKTGSIAISGTSDLYAGKITGATTVNAGGQLTVGTTPMIGVDGSLNVTSGSLVLDLGNVANPANSSVGITLRGNAEIPSGKRWTTVMGSGSARVPMAITIDQGSTLTVNGSIEAPDAASGLHVANGSTLTNNGTIAVNTHMTIGSSGAVDGSGDIAVANDALLEIDTHTTEPASTGRLSNDVSNSGTVVYNGTSNTDNLTGTIALTAGGAVYSQADISANLSGEEEASDKTFEGTTYAYAWKYDTPSIPGGGGGTAAPSFDITVAQPADGTIAVEPTSAKEGDEVTVTVTPDEGFELSELTVTDEDGNPLKLTANADGTYSFEMPAGKVNVSATFVCDGGALCPSHGFTDVDQDQWYHAAIDWAVTEGVMHGIGGTTLFDPNGDLTREQAATVMWNGWAQGDLAAPAVALTDVDQAQWYAPYVNWAVEAAVMQGYGGTDRFGVGDALTREQFAMVIANATNADPSGADASVLEDFNDPESVSDWATPVMAWAVESGVINGVALNDGTFDLQGSREVTRAEMAMMVMNAVEEGILEL